MYPDLDSTSKIVGGNQLSYKKTLTPSEAMTSAIMEIRQISTLSISSFKPHLNTHECHLSMIVNSSISIPLKIIFLRNYPKERPLIFVAKYVSHPIVNQITCQIDYENKVRWTPQSKLIDLLKAIQSEFSRNPPNDKSQIDQAVKNIDEYVKNMESLRTRPNLQPPPPPKINLQNVLKAFEYEQNLVKTCQQKNAIYLQTATEYSQNVSRVKCIGQRFSQGKILRQLQKQIDNELSHQQHGSVYDQLTKYLQSRKKYHRLKILKERYLEI